MGGQLAIAGVGGVTVNLHPGAVVVQSTAASGIELTDELVVAANTEAIAVVHTQGHRFW